MGINYPQSIVYYLHLFKKPLRAAPPRSANVSWLCLIERTGGSLVGFTARSNAATGPAVLHRSWTHIGDRVMRGWHACPFLYVFVTFLKFGNSAEGSWSPKLTPWCRERTRFQRKLCSSRKEGFSHVFGGLKPGRVNATFFFKFFLPFCMSATAGTPQESLVFKFPRQEFRGDG